MAGAHTKENAALSTTVTATLKEFESDVIAPTLSTTASRSVMAAQKAEDKRSIMIVLTGVNYIAGHLLKIVYIIKINFLPHDQNQEWGCVSFAALILLSISYSTPLFFYYFFNTQFYKFANNNIKRFIIFVVKLMHLEHIITISTSKEKDKNKVTSVTLTSL
jgi:hypothetical protein